MDERGGPPTTRKILCVDDDENILSAYQRQLRKEFQIEIALGGGQALEAMSRRGPYAVIVSDMRMPGMDGIQFLSKVKEKSPNTVRMMLTGNGDLQTAIQAVNEGNIFRFLTKPCPPEVLGKALSAGLEQYRLITSERVLLEETLSGSIRILMELLSIVDSQSFGRAEILRDLVRLVARGLGLKSTWELEVAAMLSPLGIVAIPPAVMAKARAGHPLDGIEAEMLERVPETGRKLLAKIPRLESVAEIVLYQNKHFDGSGFPIDSVAGKSIPPGARILRVLTDLVQLESAATSRPKAIELMRSRQGWYDPELLARVSSLLLPSRSTTAIPEQRISRSISAKQLQAGQLLLSDLRTTDGLLLLSSGHRISEAALARIRNVAQINAIREPILVEKT
jgi:response regulator RpfG family c-di-GMP phosphodiesterase